MIACLFTVFGLPHSAAHWKPSEQHQPWGICLRSSFPLCWYRPDLYLPPAHHRKFFRVNRPMCFSISVSNTDLSLSLSWLFQSHASQILPSTLLIKIVLCYFFMLFYKGCSYFYHIDCGFIYNKHFIFVTFHLFICILKCVLNSYTVIWYQYLAYNLREIK